MPNPKVGTNTRLVLGIGRWLAIALLLILILKALAQTLLITTAGAVLVLFLQELASPAPLFWSAPREAMQLVLSRRHRVNHLWLHRTQDLARESIGRFIKPDGFAMADGFVLIGVGRNKQLVQWTAECAWRGIGQERGGPPTLSCLAVRFLVALWLMIGGLLAVSIWHGIDLATGMLIGLISAAAGHALAKPVEKNLLKWLTIPVGLDESAGGYRLELEPVVFPEWLWCPGGQGFSVRRIPEEQPGKD